MIRINIGRNLLIPNAGSRWFSWSLANQWITVSSGKTVLKRNTFSVIEFVLLSFSILNAKPENGDPSGKNPRQSTLWRGEACEGSFRGSSSKSLAVCCSAEAAGYSTWKMESYNFSPVKIDSMITPEPPPEIQSMISRPVCRLIFRTHVICKYILLYSLITSMLL